MKRVLFICIENARRSQMAQAFANYYSGGKVKAYSAGSLPGTEVDPIAVEVMKERGIDLGAQKPKPIEDLPQKHFHYVVSMGCGDRCPFVYADEKIEWRIGDPKGGSVDVFREVREEIEEKVRKLIKRIV